MAQKDDTHARDNHQIFIEESRGERAETRIVSVRPAKKAEPPPVPPPGETPDVPVRKPKPK